MALLNTAEEIILSSKSVSIDVTKLESNGFGIAEMEANFEGVMSYLNDNGTEETHTVKGDFYYKQSF